MFLITVNAGSSSLRLGLFNIQDGDSPLAVDSQHIIAPEKFTDCMKKFLQKNRCDVDVIVHRIVHGGNRITQSQVIDQALETELEKLSTLAPLHNPVALELIRICRRLCNADVVQIVVPDTAFFSTLPDVAKYYALPQTLCDQYDIRRYGFHGIAHKAMLRSWLAMQANNKIGRRVISIQLGAGCSITASRNQKPVDTSMGFTPLEGLVMATRCGDVDAGVILYLQQQMQCSIDDLQRILNNESGLLGLSEESADTRQLLLSKSSSAKLAIDLYCYRIKKYVGAYLAVLGGVDAILFGGGAGENSWELREKILDGLEWMGIKLNPKLNQAVSDKKRYISTSDSIAICVIPVDESREMVREALSNLAIFNPER